MSDDTMKLIETLATSRPPVGGIASRQAYELLRGAIARTMLMPGTPLSEAEVAARLDMSRTPVREAFRQLSAEGLITISPQAGSFVAKLNRQEIDDALFVRQSLECAAVRLAARAPRSERERLRRIVMEQRIAIDNKDVEANLACDEALHHCILNLSGHGAAWRIVQQARTHMDRLRRIAIPELKANEKAVEQHAEIVEAIMSGDEDEAAELLSKHICMIDSYIVRIQNNHPEYFTDN